MSELYGSTGKASNERNPRMEHSKVKSPTFCTDCWAHWPHRATAERVIPVGSTGGAGGTHRETAGGQVGNFFYWQREYKMSIQIQPTDCRGFSEGQQLQANQNTEKSSQVTLKRHNLKAIKISQTGLMLWETAEHWSLRVFSAMVHHIVTELALYSFSSTSWSPSLLLVISFS